MSSMDSVLSPKTNAVGTSVIRDVVLKFCWPEIQKKKDTITLWISRSEEKGSLDHMLYASFIRCSPRNNEGQHSANLSWIKQADFPALNPAQVLRLLLNYTWIE